jgi:hypothetical protein
MTWSLISAIWSSRLIVENWGLHVSKELPAPET